MRVAWFNPFSGIAGDMALGSLVDAGADLDEVLDLCRRLPLTGWSIDAEPVLRAGLAGTHVRVRTTEHGVVRTAANILGLVEEAALPPRVHARAVATFTVLADAEGRLHRKPASQVHFHEVGGVDAILDVVGTCAALEVLGVDRVASAPVATGVGTVRAAHGVLPNPAPAVVELLRGAPTFGVDVAAELTTPTGAALLAGLAESWGAQPAIVAASVGYGAGTRDLDGRPNVVQVVVGEEHVASARTAAGQPVVLLEANVDDATGETLAHAIAALLDAGAHDAWVTPVVMKKGRPAHTVSALADPALAAQVRAVLVAETGSLGARGTTLERWPAQRSTTVVEVDGEPVRIKVSPGRVKAEHDDAATAARRLGLPLREVLARAEAAARRLPPGPDAAS
jgi:uncharacterized protein (TIGR00299 family) protein